MTKRFHILFVFILAHIAFGANSSDNTGFEQLSPELKQAILKLAMEQDELQTDLDEIISTQTDPKSRKLLEHCQNAMIEAVTLLEEKRKTDGETIAAQTEIIEQMYQALNQSLDLDGKSEEGGKPDFSFLLKRMLGIEANKIDPDNMSPSSSSPGGNGEAPSDTGGQMPGVGERGNQGAFEGASAQGKGSSDTGREPRTVPKSGGTGFSTMPNEFKGAFEEYNKTLQR